ncbi:NUDIX domain-containing protein [Streptomyces sp. NPDC059070]|uniref:NUDIX domain-containing protein n=1 Tax=Streptomyces sp. NPDC059070 TaxID=3346713 RepID=UPI0036AF6F91
MRAGKMQRALVASAAAAFIQRPDGCVLLVHHAGTRRWVMPGGKTEGGAYGGETPRQCCEREGREETGAEVSAGRLLVVQWLPSGRNGAYGHNPFACHLFVFAATLAPDASIRVPDGELLGWDWWSPADAAGAMDATNARLLAAAVRAATHTDTGPVYLEELPPAASMGVGGVGR